MAAPRQVRPPTIETDEDIRAGVRAIRRKCPHLRQIHDLIGDPPLRRYAPGFEGLARIVVGQQVSAASAKAIWQRTASIFVPFAPRTILSANEQAFRSAGLSRPKIKTLRAVSTAIDDGHLDLARLTRAPDDVVRDSLMSISGIGPWTADIYLIFCLGRPDSFAPGDLALQLAVQSILGLEQRPSPQALEDVAERWRPWRAVAARLLWDHYGAQRASWTARRPAKHSNKNQASSA